MGTKGQSRLILTVAAMFAAVFSALAQNRTEQADSLVRLMKAKSLELIEKNDTKYRKAVDATFLHNGTYLICDTALWNVDAQVINCFGNVRLIQEENILTSDKLDYLINEDLAKFRGALVQLENKKANTLRTRNLDYCTKDSTAVFRGGASMRDEGGQIIESDEGTYDSATKTFTFVSNVNMYTDSVFVKTSELNYDGAREVAHFVTYIDFWQEGNMLSAGGGWYDRGRDLFFFKDKVHGLTSTQETWSDSLYYHKALNDVQMLGRAQVQDTSRNVTGMADRIYYCDSLSRVSLSCRAAVAVRTEQEGKLDTLYCGADSLIYSTVKKCNIPEGELKASANRLSEIKDDAVTAFRRRAAEEAAAEAKRAREQNGTSMGPDLRAAGKMKGSKVSAEGEEAAPKTDSGEIPVAEPAVDPEPEPAPLDTTRVGFLTGHGHVKIFRKDMQVVCDSLCYSDLDSIARFYKNPIVWNEIVRQYRSDSLFVLLSESRAERASLMSNAFITTQESDIYYDQIRSTDMMVFFDNDSQLKRFDALGGVSALFYLEENDEIATVNKVEAKMLSAILKDGTIDRVHYFESPKSDAYPVVQLDKTDHRLKGYTWEPHLRPACKDSVTTLTIKPSERHAYESHPKAEFKQTEIYFPGYMSEVHAVLEAARIRKRTPRTAPPDTLASLSDSVLVSRPDTLAAPADTLGVVSDTLMSDSVPTVSDTLAQGPASRKEMRETARALKRAKRDARWAEKDAKDAEKAAIKAEKAKKRKRELTRREYIRMKKREAQEAKVLQQYIEYYRKQKAREDERKNKT